MGTEHSFATGDFGRQLYRLGQNWRREVDIRMRRFGLTDATWRPLLYLGRFGDGMRQTDLAAALDIEGPSLVRLLDTLGRSGLVERCEDSDDRRSKTLRLTEAGRQAYHRLAEEYEAVGRALLQPVAAQDIEVCQRVFQRIEQAMARVAATRDGEGR